MSIPNHWHEYFQDMFLLTWLKKGTRNCRLEAWTKHVHAFKALKAHLVTGDMVCPWPLGTEGIDFIAGHLDILDRKLGSLLTFHGMIATVVGLYLNFFLTGRVGRLSFWFWVFAFVWIATTLICLLAMAWVPWGDLGGKPIPQAEAEQIQALIETVVTRTAFFRLAVPLTACWLLLFLVAALTTRNGNNDRSSQPSQPTSSTPAGTINAVHSELLGTIGPFTSGFGCSALPLEDSVLNALSGIQRVNPSKIRLIGSADAQSLRPSLAKEFGNNTGLALTRARCVAGWLTQALGPRSMPLDLTVQDAVDLSPDAMKYGSPKDRRVQVWSIP
jgi:hypothetical protein